MESQAVYKTYDDGTVFGEIPALAGVWAHAATRPACERELAETLQGWIARGLDVGDPLPILDGIDLNPRHGHPARA